VSVVGAGASVLLPQALKTSAATRALKASLVFIYRYPRNLMIKRFRQACCIGLAPKLSGPILECFASISYLFRQSWSAFNVKKRSWGRFAARKAPPAPMRFLGAYYRKFEEST
jgi:hypothetical protein